MKFACCKFTENRKTQMDFFFIFLLMLLCKSLISWLAYFFELLAFSSLRW